MLSESNSSSKHYTLLSVPNGNAFVHVSSPSSSPSLSAMNHSVQSPNSLSPNPSPSLLSPPQIKPRKYSLPLINPRQQSPSEYLESSSREGRGSSPSTFLDTIALSSRRKRLSAVGIAVSHHLSTTMGWKLLASHADIVEQSKCLCARYIRFKLRKCGLIHKRLNLQKLKSLCSITLDPVASQVAAELKYLTLELERSYPKVYSSVLNNININTFPSAHSVQIVLEMIAQELFRNDITWARIAALYTISGALAIDCVQIGHAEYIMGLIDTFTTFVDRDLASWIAQQGGWDSLIYRFRTEDYWRKTLKYLLLSISIIFWAILAYCLT